MKISHPVPHTMDAAAAVAAELVPATDLAVTTAVAAARSLALLMEQTAMLRRSDAGSELPLRFAEQAISDARLAFEAAYEARSFFIKTRIASERLIGDLGFGQKCPCRDSGVDAGQKEDPIRLAA